MRRTGLAIAAMMMVFVSQGCSSPPVEPKANHETATAPPLGAAESKPPSSPKDEAAFVLPKRVRNVYSESAQTKRAWAKRMLLERRFPKEMCGERSFLLECIEAFRNPSTRVLGVFSKRECVEAVEDIVGKELNTGGKRGGLVGSFYANDLPQKLNAGSDMDIVAARMARRVLSVLLPKMRKHGARFKSTARCDALRAAASDIDGN